MICDSMSPSQVCCGGGHRREMTRKPVTGTRTHVVSLVPDGPVHPGRSCTIRDERIGVCQRR